MLLWKINLRGRNPEKQGIVVVARTGMEPDYVDSHSFAKTHQNLVNKG
jgi:hypothetical protein